VSAAGSMSRTLEGRASAKGTVFGRQGASIRYWVHGGGGEPMVLCNGLFSGVALWDRFVDHFSHTHRVLLWEYPGHGVLGGSDSRRGVSIGSFAEEGLLLLEGVGIDAAVFVGYGVGVQVILEIYRRRPGAVKALVGLCGVDKGRLSRLAPFRRGRQIAARSAENVLVPLGTPFWKALTWLWGASTLLEDKEPVARTDGMYGPKAWLGQISRTDPRIGLRSLASSWFYHPGSLLSQIKVPVLILGGAEDRLVPARHYASMVRRIPGSRLELLEGCSHRAVSRMPERVNSLVEEFLADSGLA
jgi:pimeloyl-ACP methyl ester carboxylesterase